jgi:hypothetical protein
MPTNIAPRHVAALSFRHFLIMVIWISKERNGPNGLVVAKLYLFFATLWLHFGQETYWWAVFQLDHGIKHHVLVRDIRKQSGKGQTIFQNKTENLSGLTSRYRNQSNPADSEVWDAVPNSYTGFRACRPAQA